MSNQAKRFERIIGPVNFGTQVCGEVLIDGKIFRRMDEGEQIHSSVFRVTSFAEQTVELWPAPAPGELLWVNWKCEFFTEGRD